ncbi:hypothetical protein ACA373_21680 [Erwinia sp. STN24]|uniref:hypothetical protein n=1 Tax=Erwinia sp. STN24 TaxID=3233996 RepID=UPI003522DC30
MKRVFLIGSLLAAASFSPSLLAAQSAQDASVDARLLIISTQLDKTNALLAKIVGEAPDNAAAEKPRIEPELTKRLDAYKERIINTCSGFNADARRYPEGETIVVKGKTYKCVTSPHWQEQ